MRISANEADLPLKPAVARAAALWFVQLTSHEVSDADRRACETWRMADPEHERAWQRTQQLGQQFSTLAPSASMAALNRPASSERRQVVKHLSVLLMLGTTGLVSYKTSSWQTCDYRTNTGERRTLILADGSSLIMNTATAINIRFTTDARRIHLLHGEIFIATAKENGPFRPLSVETTEGLLTALGTRFSVRQLDHISRLSVEESAVEIQPKKDVETQRIIRAGQIATFSKDQVLEISALDDTNLAWRNGVLIADRMRLDDFVFELGRYRRGILRCDPKIANMEISGSFPLSDTDRILQSLVDTLPIKVSMVTRYWVQIASV